MLTRKKYLITIQESKLNHSLNVVTEFKSWVDSKKGHVFPIFGFTAHHDHVVEMFHKIADNGYNVVYLTARSIASDINTREYLFQVSRMKILL